MAIAPSLYFLIKDSKGLVSKLPIHFDLSAGYDLSLIEVTFNAIGELIEAMITGSVVGGGVSLDLTMAASQNVGLASDVQEKALFSWITEEGFKTEHNISTFDESKFIEGTVEVDYADEDVAAWITFMEDGMTGVPVYDLIPTDAHGDDVTDINYARENWGKFRLPRISA